MDVKVNIHAKAAGRLKEDREKLISRFSRIPSSEFLMKHTELIDSYFMECFEKSLAGMNMGISKRPYAIIALGGYGRAEQCVRSDVDVLFLFRNEVPKEAVELIREMIYPLWDMGMEVGHSTRSIKESINMAQQDLEFLTSILDARFICGMSPLFTEVMEKIHEKCVRPQQKTYLTRLIDSAAARHLQAGDSEGVLEPNLKNGVGGLRDYHSIMWLGKIRFGLKLQRDLEYYGHLSNEEFERLGAVLEFIWKVRNNLHIITGRKCDQLYFEHQERLAEAMGFKPKAGEKAVERFLGELHSAMDTVKQLYLMIVSESVPSKRLSLRRTFPKKCKCPDLVINRETLGFASSEDVLRNKELLIQIFHESAVSKIQIGTEAKRIIREFGYLADQFYLADPVRMKMFEKILSVPAKGFSVLNDMLSTGFLERIVPELKTIRHRIQYNQYHIHPVDRHSVNTVNILASFGEDKESNLKSDIFKTLKSRPALFWAAFLHDIGKGVASPTHCVEGAEIAKKILTRIGYRTSFIETVTFLIEMHLFLIQAATRRDINDEETAVFCAMKIRDPERLKMLYLLSVADSMATGPKAWNTWTASLLRELFFKVMNTIKTGEVISARAIKNLDAKKLTILEAWQNLGGPDINPESFINQISTRYLISTPVENIMKHLNLYSERPQGDFLWDVDIKEGSEVRTVTIMAEDRPGHLSSVSGVFTLNGIDILDAQAYPWPKNTGLSIFTVKAPPDIIFESERWDKARENLRAVLAGEKNIEEELAKRKKPALKINGSSGKNWSVRIDSEWSSFFTIIEVTAHDAPGLLFCITRALHICGLDVAVAKIATRVDQVMDIFYVREPSGGKVADSETQEKIRSEIGLALDNFFEIGS
ncbi:[protein-PII] uridylyltransferase [Desulforegula conservatrix]|uniref:[protein-PII] uridylyltransferase n=1 Tax=Desulforegula conservatrix TaxID=153026 RepID=UPI000426D1ED|nr:[protein-PII] uridylyltransferase [Desulforegula conservatrix]